MARKTKEEAQRTKEKLLDSALEVMCERPYSRISMTEIAERIGYSKGAIYWHFNNKHDLLIRLVDVSCAKAEEELSKAISMQHSLDGLRRYYKYLMSLPSWNNTIKMFYKLMMHRQEWPGDVHEKVTNLLISRVDQEREIIEKMLISMQREGKIDKNISAKDMAALISAIFRGLFMFQVEETLYHTDFSIYVDQIFDLIQRDLAMPHPGSGRSVAEVKN